MKEITNMANIANKYVDATSERSVSADKPRYNKDYRQRVLKRKELRAIKKLAKCIRKYNKLQEQEAARREAEEDNTKKAPEKVNKRKVDSGAGGFFRKLGDAICKAVPMILTALAKVAFDHFLKARLSGKAPQAA